jgi:protein-tyrosine phosphatase
MKADRHEVYPNLFVGSALVTLPVGFDVIVFSAVEHQEPWKSRNQLLVYVPLDDAQPSKADEAQVIRVATYLAGALREGRRVLVTCSMGRNRSCWIAGMTMRLMRVPFRRVVSQIRTARGPEALSNRWFLASLEGI